MHYTPTAADWAWVAKTAIADAAKGGPKNSLNEAEFYDFANSFATHFGLCH